MTVKELIEYLQTLPGELNVCVPDSNGDNFVSPTYISVDTLYVSDDETLQRSYEDLGIDDVDEETDEVVRIM